MSLLKISLFGLIFVFSSQKIFAGETLNTKIHNQYISLRAMGMGNAFTAVADDYSLIFYNPAGFANKKNNEIQMSFAGAGVNTKTLTMVKDLDDASKKGTSDEEKAQNIATALEPYYGKAVGGRIQAIELFWVRKHWGTALIPVDLSLDITVNKQLGPSIDLNVKGDTTFAYGYGNDWNKELSWGFTLKGIHRVSVDENLPVLELAANSNVLSEDRMKEGITADIDVGFLYTPGWFIKKMKRKSQQVSRNKKNIAKKRAIASSAQPAQPVELTAEATSASGTTTVVDTAATTILTQSTSAAAVTIESSLIASVSGTAAASATAEVNTTDEEKEKEKILAEKADEKIEENYPLTFSLVGRNLAGGNFFKSKLVNKKATEAPEKMPTVIDLGSQYEITKFGSLIIRTMIDFKNILHPEITFNKSLHAGLEFDFSPSGWFKTQLRGGMNQGYYTAGATLLLGIFNIEAATYGEEVGTATTQLENRIYAAKFGMNF